MLEINVHRKKILLTFFVQYMDGTGFPDALHSKVIAPPFRACTCPDVGTARIVGGTVKKKKCFSKINNFEEPGI